MCILDIIPEIMHLRFRTIKILNCTHCSCQSELMEKILRTILRYTDVVVRQILYPQKTSWVPTNIIHSFPKKFSSTKSTFYALYFKNLGLLFKLQPGRKFFIKWSMILKIACDHLYVTEKLQITTLTCVLMDNFCPCFLVDFNCF